MLHATALVSRIRTASTICLVGNWIVESRSVELLSLLMTRVWLVLVLVLLILHLVLHVRVVKSIRFTEHHNSVITFILIRIALTVCLIST